jgi:two-component system alkaline phosphatase synthesis response regulator PhoP
MIWLVGQDLNQYRQLIHSFVIRKIQSRQFHALSEVINNKNESPDAILIDIDGMEALSLEYCWIATHSNDNKKTNILLFSSNADEAIEVSAFEAGANDFILKPFKPAAVVERISTRLEKVSSKHVIRSVVDGEHPLEIDKEKFSVRFKEEEVLFSRKEFELLFLLAGNPGKVYRREELYKALWSGEYDPKDRTIDVHILRIRKKISDNSIITIKGVGYRFNLKYQ